MLSDCSTPIILVTTDTMVARLFIGMLEKLEFAAVQSTKDSAAALAALQSVGPGIVIADLQLNHESGLDLALKIRSDDKLKRSPFVLFSTTLTGAEAMAMKPAGVDSFLLLPFRPEVLAPKLEAAISRRVYRRSTTDMHMMRSSLALGRRFGHWQQTRLS